MDRDNLGGVKSGEQPTGTNGDSGVTRLHVPTLIITLDPVSLMVHLKCDDVKISVAQMMIEEVRRQLDIQRRQAAAMELQQNLAEARRVAAIVGGNKFRG